MKNERGAIKLITFISIVVILALVILGTILYLSNKEKNNDSNTINEWRKVDLGKDYYVDEQIELDLDGDKVKEKIDIKATGKYIFINDKKYIANKYYKENNNNSTSRRLVNPLNLEDYRANQYHIVDLNNDGVLEIIHRTYIESISPQTSEYTIFNYKYSDLIEIGEFSIVGNMPHEIYVRKNTIKFKYWPYESPEDYTEEVVCELNI